jgi:hypothetical protein
MRQQSLARFRGRLYYLADNNGVNAIEFRNFLLAAAQDAGFEVTPRQLARWHQEGLLPRPKQHSLGRGKGTESIYLDGTAKQLIALCRFKRNQRRLDYLAWQLWWAGFEVEIATVRKFIQAQWRAWDIDIATLVERGSGKLSKAAVRALKTAGDARLKNKIVRQARRRTGRDAFGELSQMVVILATGKFQKTLRSEDLLQNALGMMPFGHQKTAPLWLPQGIDDSELKELSAFMKNEFQSLQLERLDDKQLLAGMDQCRNLLNFLSDLRELTDRFNIRMGLNLIDPLLRGPDYQCLLLRFYLAAKSSSFAGRMSEFESMIGEWRQLLNVTAG